MIKYAIVGALIGLFAATVLVGEPKAGMFTACKVKHVYEDGSFAMVCPPISTPDWGPGGY